MTIEDMYDIFKKNDAYVFGAGFKGKACLNILEKYGVHVNAFWDNDCSKYNDTIKGISVMAPFFIQNAIVIVAIEKYWIEVTEQLIDLGFTNDMLLFPEELEYLCLDDVEKEMDYELPKVIQMPITYKCNFDCVMCGMKNLIKNRDFDYKELEKILKDKLFSQITTVGINGGEPFLKEDLVECIRVMIDTLPLLKEFYFISNGFFTEKILKELEIIKSICEKSHKKIYLSISIDGINDMHDFHRGREKAFKNAERTIHEIRKNEKKYVDDLNAICTITKYNIARINELVVWAEKENIEVEYNIATPNKRIDNFNKVQDFYVFSDEHSRMLATEFFYGLYKKTGQERYFSAYLSLRYNKRFSVCPYQHKEWITLTPDGDVSFCTSYSDSIGSAVTNSAYDLFVKYGDKVHREVKKYCNECIHNHDNLNVEGKKLLIEDKIKRFRMR